MRLKCLLLKSSQRADTRGQAIFELDNKEYNRKTPGRFLTKTRGALLGIAFSLFLLFPNPSYAATVFLPDAQNEEVFNTLSAPPEVAIDSVRCEDIGYTYYSSGQCPAYHNQDTCVFSDRYLKCDAVEWCRDNDYIITSCSSPKYLDSQCPNGLSLYKYCVCPGEYKYSCTGTGYSGGSGTACDGKYTACNCATNYSWNGSSCIQPHTHSYSCPSGAYSSSSYCSYGTSGTTSKVCSCGATSGTCYYCNSSNSSSSSGESYETNYDYSCPEWACETVHGVYHPYENACTKSCADLVCGECACEAAGGTLVDGYCTTWCGMCMGDPIIHDSSGFPF